MHYTGLVLALGFMLVFSYSSNAQLPTPTHPSIYISQANESGLLSVSQLELTRQTEHPQKLWKELDEALQKDLQFDFIDRTTDFDRRDPNHRRHENFSYDMERGLTERLGRFALMYLLSKEDRYKHAILRQIEALYDDQYFPHWCDDAHMNEAPFVDIRTYRISMWIALCYDWLYEDLSPEQRTWIIQGLDRKAIQPFWQKLAQRPGWYQHRHNWFTNMFGGMGITMMALGSDHPDTQRALDTIVPPMLEFNERMGDQGEFNEPPGYAGAVRFQVEFAEAYRYYTKGKSNILGNWPFPELSYWIMQHTLPPGRLTKFGDTNENQKISDPAIIAAIAGAAQDPILQYYYLQNSEELHSPLELLWYDPSLQPQSPAGNLPRAVAYAEYGMDLISRTDWNPLTTSSVVYGKAGRETNHDDNDVGQVCLDGFGQPLIIDCGKPDPVYPIDYFGPDQFNYYTRSSRGHNLIVIDQAEIRSEPNHSAHGSIDTFYADDQVGAAWQIDLSPVYPNAKKINRTVLHLHPTLMVVVDEVDLAQPSQIDLRWHTAATPIIDKNQFSVTNGDAAVVAMVKSIGTANNALSSGVQSFEAPFNLSRQGDELKQDHEPFVLLSQSVQSCQIISLFCVLPANEKLPKWTMSGTTFSIETAEESYKVIINEKGITARNSTDSLLQLPLARQH